MSITHTLRVVMLVAVASSLAAASAHAQSSSSPIGVGWQIGDPSGPTAKLWLSSSNALQATIGWRTSIRDPVYINGYYYYRPALSYGYASLDWVHQFRRVVSRSRTVAVGGYVGVGGGVGELPAGRYYDAFGHDYYVSGGTAAEVRVPIGAHLALLRAHFELYAEIVPVVRIVPEPFPNVLADVGGRYYF